MSISIQIHADTPEEYQRFLLVLAMGANIPMVVPRGSLDVMSDPVPAQESEAETNAEPVGAAEDVTAVMAAGREPIPDDELEDVAPAAPSKRKRRTKAEMAADEAAAREAENQEDERGETIEDQAAEASANAATGEDGDNQTALDKALLMLRAFHLSGRDDAAAVIEKLRAEFKVEKFYDVPAARGPELLARAQTISATPAPTAPAAAPFNPF